MLVQLSSAPTSRKRATVTWPPGAPGVSLKTVYSIGLRLIFDWRHYF